MNDEISLLRSWLELARGGAFGEEYTRDAASGCALTCEPGSDAACVVCATEEFLLNHDLDVKLAFGAREAGAV